MIIGNYRIVDINKEW